MTKGYQVQMKQTVNDLRKKHKTGCHLFRVQSSMIGSVKVTYRTLDKVDREEIFEFGEENASLAFSELTACIHDLNQNQ